MSEQDHENQQKRLAVIDRRLKSLRDALPFADGQAYHQDQRKIRELERERAELVRGMTEKQA